MSNYSKTITHALEIDDAPEGLAVLFDVVTWMANDLDCTDGRILITVQQKSTDTVDAIAGALVPGGTMIDNVYAIREFPSQREIDQSNGKIRVGDRKFHYKSNEASFVPVVGDRVVVAGLKYDIVAVDVQTLGTRYLVFCRA